MLIKRTGKDLKDYWLRRMVDIPRVYEVEYDFIKTAPYDMFIDHYTKHGTFHYNLHRIILLRLKDKDLPLVMHIDWRNNDLVQYEKRLKGEPMDEDYK